MYGTRVRTLEPDSRRGSPRSRATNAEEEIIRPYDQVFTPGAPIASEKLLVGRRQELQDLRNAIRRAGHHPIVIGNRGVGKTSVVSLAFRGVSPAPVRVGCSPSQTFDQLAHAILSSLGIDPTVQESEIKTERALESGAAVLGVGLKGSSIEGSRTTRAGVGSRPLDSWALFEIIRATVPRRIIIIDEYDAIPQTNRAFHEGIAYLIKHFADHSTECDVRIVIVGVAQSAAALLGQHESIERSAREIYLRPLRREDVQDFLVEAERLTRISFTPQVRAFIVSDSLGYPYYVHLVGLECIDAMLTRDRRARTVEVGDHGRAVGRAVQHAFRSELRKYGQAIASASRAEMTIIRELAISEERDPQRLTLRGQLEQRKSMSSSEFDSALASLEQEKRLVYVSRTRDVVRFADPLMAPFLRTWILRSPPARAGYHRDQLQLFDDP